MASESEWRTEAEEADKACDKCGAPASWTDEGSLNLTYRESLLDCFKRYFASPRMWPIGYIGVSPYSPLSLEREMPSRNWRDAFEDLLALESGGEMIDYESREKEAITAERLWREELFEGVSTVNRQLQRDEKYMLLLKRIRKAHACAKLTNVMKSIDEEEIPQLTENSRLSVLAGETVISKLKDEENQGRPASMYKRRGQWIASLITSGAIVGWQSDLVDSAKGEYINFKKLEPADDGSYDGMTFTELEMIDYFERNVPMEYLIPSWSTIGLEYPQSFSFSSPDSMQDVINDDNEKEHKVPPSVNSVRPTLVMPTSILAQHIMAERTRLRSGRISVKVLLQNFHTNGKTVKKEITDDACRVLEEGATVRSSMKAMYDAIGFTSQDQFYAREEEQLKNFEEELD